MTEEKPEFDSIEVLRRLHAIINRTHREALLALLEIEGHLSAEPVPFCQQPKFSSMRLLVVSVLEEGPKSSEDLTKATGLTRRQVTGVVCSSTMRDRIVRQKIDKVIHYGLKDSEPEDEVEVTDD